MEDLGAQDAYHEGGGECLGAPAEALTSYEAEVVHGAAMSYDDLKLTGKKTPLSLSLCLSLSLSLSLCVLSLIHI